MHGTVLSAALPSTSGRPHGCGEQLAFSAAPHINGGRLRARSGLSQQQRLQRAAAFASAAMGDSKVHNKYK